MTSLDQNNEEKDSRPVPTLRELYWEFFKIAMYSFGGGMSAWAQVVIVEDKKWMSEEEFLSGLTVCRVLPGANQINMAIYCGNKLRGIPGMLAALGGAVMIPFLIVLGLGIAYFHFHKVPALQTTLKGVTAAATGMTLSMGLKIIGKYIRQLDAILITVLTFYLMSILKMRLLDVVVLVGIASYLWYARKLKKQSQEKKGTTP